MKRTGNHLKEYSQKNKLIVVYTLSYCIGEIGVWSQDSFWGTQRKKSSGVIMRDTEEGGSQKLNRPDVQ